MSIGVEVDELALMLDGVYDKGDRFCSANVEALEAFECNRLIISSMAVHVVEEQWAEVAQAILELEACADWRFTLRADLDSSNAAYFAPYDLHGEPGSSLAVDAWIHAIAAAGLEDLGIQDYLPTLLEAAALLRDGWRPKGWGK